MIATDHKSIDVPKDVHNAGPQAVRIYKQAIANGTKPRMAEMFAMRQAAGLETDTVFQKGFGTLLNQFGNSKRSLERHVKACQRQGYTPGVNDIYLPTIAEKYADPKAHVKTIGEAVKLCEQRGVPLEINGKQVLKGREAERDWMADACPLADQFVVEAAPALIAKDPKLAKASLEEMRAAAVDVHGGRYSKEMIKKAGK